MRGTAIALYGLISYVIFLGTFVYAIGFVGGIGVPRSLDAGPADPVGRALAVDLALLGLFAVQHSVMARRPFKRWLTRFIPAEAERSTFVLASSVALLVMFWQWRPLGGVVWEVASPAGRGLLHAGFAFGWGLVLASTFAINHFDLFGLRQVWHAWRGHGATPLPFATPWLYRLVRHPLYVGWFFAFWCTPRMTAAHLLFAVMTTAYILVAIQLEERDLIVAHPEYAAYRQRVPMLVPAWRSRAGSSSSGAVPTGPDTPVHGSRHAIGG
jgi:protein-S-isoprenylcysteine O-methyltransferase Ste14